jgi:alpha-tubulin suppressor-like RCC1 family protein
LDGVTSISAGNRTGFAVRHDGTVWAWGDNSNCQLGTFDCGSSTSPPTQIAGLADVIAVQGLGGAALALKSDGTVWGWGRDNQFLGYGPPTQIAGLHDITAIAGQGGTAYALRLDGTVWSWGSNEEGALGDGSTVIGRTSVGRVRKLTDVKAIAGTLALRRDGSVWAWGPYDGDGDIDSSNLPKQVAGLEDVRRIARGWAAYVLLADHTVRAWGRGLDGQLGNGAFGSLNRPVRVRGVAGATRIAGGDSNGYAIVPALN